MYTPSHVRLALFGMSLVAVPLAVACAQSGGEEPPLVRPVARPRPNDFPTYQGRLTAVDATAITVQGIAAAINGAGPLTAEERRQDFASHRWTSRGERLEVRFPERTLTCRQAVFTWDTAILTDADGGVTVVRRTDEPQRRFRLAKSLAAGGFGTDWLAGRASVAYRVGDLRVGDEVNISLDLEDRQRVCGLVVIERRPGGRVPPAPHEPLAEGFPRHHERMNALQDWEQGIPLPDRFRELYADVLPEVTPVAPPPRRLPPRIPVAAP